MKHGGGRTTDSVDSTFKNKSHTPITITNPGWPCRVLDECTKLCVPPFQGVAVHCMHGHGRTGTMLACYLVKSMNLSGIDAIKKIRKLRQGSIETHEQEKAVVQFYQRTKY